jgi:hypothetical protein
MARADGLDHYWSQQHSIMQLMLRLEDYTDPDPGAKPSVKVKTKENLLRSVIWYLENFSDDPAKTYIKTDGKPAVEQSFRFELGFGPQTGKYKCTGGHDLCGQSYPSKDCPYCENDPAQPYLLCGHLDRVVTFNDELFVMDRKTTTITPSEYYFNQYEPNNQMTLYTLAAKVVVGSPVKGVIIDAAQLLMEETKFGRSFTYRTDDFLHEWVEDLGIWFSMAENYAIANYWPKNDTACDKFGGCKFKSICSKSPQVRDTFLRSQFKQLPEDARWNPLKPR